MTRQHLRWAGIAVLASSCWLGGSAPSASAAESTVRVYEKDVVIPTYPAGAPEKSPMFYFGRQSQGAEGRIYPYPLYDSLAGTKVDRTYRLVILENEYVRIGILPEIGGRIFEAVDKTNNYDFFYRQHVIKPALIGLIGAWISGGVEWNIPHHHRASTFLPVQYRIVEDDDGGKTVWVGELELRHRMRWAVGYTLRPGRSVLEASVRIVNRTPVVNTMLCFANAAVHVNENYQVIFPPSTQYVTHHHKREFTTWPIATTRYGGHDFRPGTDVSWFKNHVAANSMFAWNYSDDFFAGYDHGKEAGTMSVADHHAVPGKKLWTWGNGPRGRMWDKILTDEDGPYIELMVGAFSDNQPDYSWLQPFEEKSFSMNWYPFRGIGGVKKANLDAAVNLDVNDGVARVGFCTTATHPRATARLVADDRVLMEETTAIDPGTPYRKEVRLPSGIDPDRLRAALVEQDRVLVDYAPVRPKPAPMPGPDRFPPPLREIKTNEELYLAGLKVEQFHDPGLDPDPFWEEALKRDPGDARVNAALGIRRLKQARYAEAESLLRRAIERLTAGYVAPKDGEPYYYLGLALKAQGRFEDADEALSKATWSLAWRAAGSYERAELAARRRDFPAALDLVVQSLEANALNLRALNLRAAVLRHLPGSNAASIRETPALLATRPDPLDVRTMAERWLASRDPRDARELTATLAAYPGAAEETAAEYLGSGLWEDGLAVLSLLADEAPDRSRLPISPLVYYDMAFFAARMGHDAKASAYRDLARKQPPDYVFPISPETIEVLRDAMKADPKDARAPYYLGNLLFDSQPDEAVTLWETAAALDPSLAMAHRNLGVALSHRPGGNNPARAIAELEKAVALPGRSPLHLVELDELYRAAGKAPEERLAMLEAHHGEVETRAEALSREIALLILAGRHDDAIRRMTGRTFEVWEGGRLSVAEDWTSAHILRAHRHRAAGRFPEALADLEAAGHVPDNLPSDEGGGDRSAEIAWAVGLVREAMGDAEGARKAWQQAAAPEPAGHGRGNGAGRGPSGRSVQRFHQALALRKLGRSEDAATIFRDLRDSGTAAAREKATVADTAPVAVRQGDRDRLALAHFVASLGHLGLGEADQAGRERKEALAVSPDHLGARTVAQTIGGEPKTPSP
ncbi:DUF5107 domain-containing protein [Aquisphaera insulae]|uniref:DUF5107 domain-containing protein n=1 Tax=Aquisphaera insulae TaxID=2712864 RepID=UPI0013EB89D2|nr:DUF5107 domain-containing protein [Aquisphaera insulae]